MPPLRAEGAGGGRLAGHYARINEVYARFFPEAPPARSFVPVAAWPFDFDIEIECVALA